MSSWRAVWPDTLWQCHAHRGTQRDAQTRRLQSRVTLFGVEGWTSIAIAPASSREKPHTDKRATRS